MKNQHGFIMPEQTEPSSSEGAIYQEVSILFLPAILKSAILAQMHPRFLAALIELQMRCDLITISGLHGF